ncbi:MAG TPA: HAD family hydrolase [Geobacteraceae bacterium]|nr:HAD family hydrolase [Geobacteraceae bacterium]
MNNNTNIIWDIGNVLISYSRVTEEYYDLCHDAHVEIALEFFPMLSAEEAQYLVDECYNSFQDCYGAFIPVIIHYGLDLEKTRLRLFKKHYGNLYELLMKNSPHIFGDTADLVDAFRGISGRVKHGVLSQCCMETFGIPVLDKLGLLPFFEPNAILGLDQVGFVKKAESAEPLRIVLELMDADPEHTYFVEDTLSNLERASEIKGLRCIYINHGKPLDTLPSFVSNQFRETTDFLRFLKEEVGGMGAGIPAVESSTSETDLVESDVRRQRLPSWSWAIVGIVILAAIFFLRYIV